MKLKNIADLLFPKLPFYGESILNNSERSAYHELIKKAEALNPESRINKIVYGENKVRKFLDNDLEKSCENILDLKKDRAFYSISESEKVKNKLSEYANVFHETFELCEAEYLKQRQITLTEQKKLFDLEKKENELEKKYYSQFPKTGFIESGKIFVSNLFSGRKAYTKNEIEKSICKSELKKDLENLKSEIKSQKNNLNLQKKYFSKLNKELNYIKNSLDLIEHLKNDLNDSKSFYENYLKSFNILM